MINYKFNKSNIKLTNKEKELLEDFNKLDEKDQEFIIKLLEVFSSKNDDYSVKKLIS